MASNPDREVLLAQICINLVFTRVSGFFRSSTSFPCPERFSAPLGARKCLSPTKEAVITTVATIVGIVGGTIAIAEQIRKWYQDYKKGKAGKTIKAVLIVGRNGQSLWLENATIEQIQKILEE